jgi:acetyl-CoA C-acetyltransferase
MGDASAIDAMIAALTDPFDDCHMGVTAENVADKWSITREDQDALAMQSHQRAAAAIADGRFTDQILPVEIKGRKGTTVVAQDEHVRADITLGDLAKLRPAFAKDGSVTAGNSSGVNDAAAAVVLADGGTARAKGLTPLGRLIAYSHVGVEPRHMGIGPVPAVRSVLDKAGLALSDIDVFEVNEAFAAQALAVARDLGLPAEKTNPNGSGVGLGHPIGATGAILTVKVLYELARINGRYGLVTMCIGGGQGIAAIYERS